MKDPSVISKAPIDVEPQDYNSNESDFYSQLVAELQDENDFLRGELEAEKAKGQIAKVKAEMMRPYADKVFIFVCVYCLVVGAMILAHGDPSNSFTLTDTIVSVIAGSTAV